MTKKKILPTGRLTATALLSFYLLLSQTAVSLGANSEVRTLNAKASNDTATGSDFSQTPMGYLTVQISNHFMIKSSSTSQSPVLDLHAALNNAEGEQLIRLDTDHTLTEPVTIVAGSTDNPVVLDLNGYHLQWNAAVIVEGALCIRDSSKPQKGIISVPAEVVYPGNSQPEIRSLFQLTDGAALKLENLNIITDSPLISLPSSGMGTFTMADCTVGTAAESKVPATVIFRIEDNPIPISDRAEKK